MPNYRRILLKLSGEALASEKQFGVDAHACEKIAISIKELLALGIQVGIVIGGGNIFRGSLAKEFGFERTPADHIGMLATVMNGLILQQSLAKIGCKSRVMSAIACDSFIESYHYNGAIEALEAGICVIFVGGTGNPYFTTDTAAALRASEIHAEILFKATKVAGVFNKDPLKHKDATQYKTLTYAAALKEKLEVMDATSLALCRENRIPIYVFDLFSPSAMVKALQGQGSGTLIVGE